MKLEVETALDKHLKVLNDIGLHKFPRLFKVYSSALGKYWKKYQIKFCGVVEHW